MAPYERYRRGGTPRPLPGDTPGPPLLGLPAPAGLAPGKERCPKDRDPRGGGRGAAGDDREEGKTGLGGGGGDRDGEGGVCKGGGPGLSVPRPGMGGGKPPAVPLTASGAARSSGRGQGEFAARVSPPSWRRREPRGTAAASSTTTSSSSSSSSRSVGPAGSAGYGGREAAEEEEGGGEQQPAAAPPGLSHESSPRPQLAGGGHRTPR